jgi:hypothetical protein
MKLTKQKLQVMLVLPQNFRKETIMAKKAAATKKPGKTGKKSC